MAAVREVISILIDNKHTAIEEEVVEAAVGNYGIGKEVMMVLLEQRCADIIIAAEVVKAAATCGQEGALKTIEEYFKISPSKEE